MNTDTHHTQWVTWVVIICVLTLGAGAYWFVTKEFTGRAAETVNVAHTEALTGSSLGLVGYWTLDGSDIKWSDSTTEIKDTSGNSKHGDAQGSLAAGSATPGQVGQGLRFNGTSDVISLGTVYNGVKTIAFWAKPNSTTQPFIDLNATATINMTSGTVAANSFTSPTYYKDGSPFLVSSGSVAYRSSNATTYATRTNTTLTAPAGIQNGDLLVIIFDIGGASPPTPTPPSGFSTLPSFSSPLSMTVGGFNVKMYAWYKFASSESGNYTVTHSSASSQGYIVALSGADPTTPFSPNPTTNTGTGSTTTATGLTTPYDNSLVMFVSSDWGDNANNLTGPSGSTPTFTKRMGATTQSGILYVADGVLGTAGATGDKTITNNSTGSNAWGGVLISVQPPTTPGAPTIDTNWHHIVITTGTGINASAVNLGKISSSYLGGILDDVRFYSTALSATQVTDLYRASNAKEVDNANHREVLTNGLVGYWTFDGRDIKWSDTGTEIKDISGNGNHGDALGSLATTSVIPGTLGQALSFNGSSDYVDIGTLADTATTSAFTVSAWIYQSSLVSGSIVTRSKDTNPFWLVDSNDTYGGSDDIRTFIESGSGDNFGYTTDNVHSSGSWEHWVSVFDGTLSGNANRLKLYKNGTQQSLTFIGTIPAATVSSGTVHANIGGYYNSASWNGKIDDVRIYNRALSSSEVANLYSIGR